MTGDSGAGARYTAWEAVYAVSLRDQARANNPRSRRRRAVIAVLAVIEVVVLVFIAVRLVVALVRWDPAALLGTLLSPYVLPLLLVAAWVRWPPQTRVTAHGLAVRSEPWRTRSVPWADVVDVGPPGRFDDHPVARLIDGARLALVGLPVEVAREMAEVTSPPRPTRRAASAPRQPAPEDDLDGPFRRGRTAR